MTLPNISCHAPVRTPSTPSWWNQQSILSDGQNEVGSCKEFAHIRLLMYRREACCIERSPMRRGAKRLLRKEVIQPHLPVRLPCYDFTPIASPTFDGSLHKG